MFNPLIMMRKSVVVLFLFYSCALWATNPQTIREHALPNETFAKNDTEKDNPNSESQLHWLLTTDMKDCGLDAQQCRLINEMLATETAKQRYEDSLLMYYGYDLKNAKAAFDFQSYSTRFIFWMVIVIVTLGVFFAVINFIQSISLLKKKAGKDVPTEFKAGLDGVEIKTSLVGFLIEHYGGDRFTDFCRQLRDGNN